MKIIEWIKSNPIAAVVLVAALILLFFSGSTVKKTEEKYVASKSKSVSLQTSLDTVTKNFEDYKKSYNQDLEWVKEPVIGPDGKALLDGKGNAIYRRTLRKKTSASSSGSSSGESHTQAVTQYVYAEAVTIYKEKIETVNKQNRIALYMGATIDAVNPSQIIKSKAIVGCSVRAFKGLGGGVYVTTPFTFKKEGVELYLGPAFWW